MTIFSGRREHQTKRNAGKTASVAVGRLVMRPGFLQKLLSHLETYRFTPDWKHTPRCTQHPAHALLSLAATA